MLLASFEKQSTVTEDEQLLDDVHHWTLSSNGKMAVVYRLEKKKIILDQIELAAWLTNVL